MKRAVRWMMCLYGICQPVAIQEYEAVGDNHVAVLYLECLWCGRHCGSRVKAGR